MWSVAWIAAISGLGLGAMGALIPGFPGSAVALLGLVCFASLTDFAIVTNDAIVLATGIAVICSVGQIAGPAMGSRALGGAASVATGAAVGSAIGVLVPLPGFLWIGGCVGAIGMGLVSFRTSLFERLRGVAGAAGGCFVSAFVDFIGVLGIATILAISDYLALHPN